MKRRYQIIILSFLLVSALLCSFIFIAKQSEFENLSEHKYVIADKNGKILSSRKYNPFYKFNEYTKNRLYISDEKDNGKILDIKGKSTFNTRFRTIKPIAKNIYQAESYIGKKYIINEKGKKLLNIKNNCFVSDISEIGNVFLIKEYKKKYSYDKKNLVQPAEIYNFNMKKIYSGNVSNIYEFTEDRIYVTERNSAKIIDFNGNIIADDIYFKIIDEADNNTFGKIFKQKHENNYYLIDINNNKIVPFEIQDYKFINQNSFWILVNDKWGKYLIKENKWEYKPQFDGIPKITNNYRIIPIYKTMSDGKKTLREYLCDNTYKPYKNNQDYIKIYPVNNYNFILLIKFYNPQKDGNIFLAESKDYQYIIDNKANILYKTQKGELIKDFTEQHFSNGVYEKPYVSLKTKYGKNIQDIKGENILLLGSYVILKPSFRKFKILNNKYQHIHTFEADKIKDIPPHYLLVRFNDKYKLIDYYSGTVNLDYDYIEYADKELNQKIFNKQTDNFINLYIARKDNKIGIVDSSNKTIIPFIYEDYNIIKNNNKSIYIALKKDNKWGIKSINNENLYDFIYTYKPIMIFDDFIILDVTK